MAYEQLGSPEIARSEPRKPLVVAHSAAEWLELFGNPAKATAATVGNRKILDDVAQRAHQSQWMPAVLTFDPHPTRILRPEAAPLQIEMLAQRLEGFSRSGIEAALVLPFTLELAQVSAHAFVEKFLVETMRAKAVLVGESFRFGHRQEGDVRLLETLGDKFGFEVDVIAPVGDGNSMVSSSAIRQAVSEGRMEVARHMLGRPFALLGEIRPGTEQGRKLVVPTLTSTSPRTRCIRTADLESDHAARAAPEERRVCDGKRGAWKNVSIGHEHWGTSDFRWAASFDRVAFV